MKDEFAIHNLHHRDINLFKNDDPHLSKLLKNPFIYKSNLITDIPVLTPGIYILTGGRQVGKSTLLKLIIQRLIETDGQDARQLFYLPCDTIVDFRHLLFEIEEFTQEKDQSKSFVLCLDEIQYVSGWERAIKSLADGGYFANGSVIITGSDAIILKEAMMMFPGRRGFAEEQDFHLFSLSFREYVRLKDEGLCNECQDFKILFQDGFTIQTKMTEGIVNRLQIFFDQYLLTGGFMPAINMLAQTGKIQPAVYRTYLQWIVGDFLKRKKNENYLKEIVSAVIQRLSSQISWHNISSAMSIDHHQTVADYINILCRMDAAVILPALDEGKMQAAPKKAKKIFICDPFVLHALHAWVKDDSEPFELASRTLKERGRLGDAIIEGVLASLCHRQHRTFYIKAEGEVDIAIVDGNKFLPIEIKNSPELKTAELKQIMKYKQGIVGYSGTEIGKFCQLDVIPIPMLAMMV